METNKPEGLLCSNPPHRNHEKGGSKIALTMIETFRRKKKSPFLPCSSRTLLLINREGLVQHEEHFFPALRKKRKEYKRNIFHTIIDALFISNFSLLTFHNEGLPNERRQLKAAERCSMDTYCWT